MPIIWKDIPGYEGKYQASNLGEIRSRDRFWLQKSRVGKAYKHFKKGKVLRPGKASHGYFTVCLARGKTHCVHKLIALAWHGKKPEKLEVCHKNGIKTDCRPSNLYYGTRSQNNFDMAAQDKLKISRKTVKNIKLAIANGQRAGFIADFYNVSRSYVCAIKAGKLRKNG